MTYTKSTGEDHPFHHTTVVYFKGGPHSGAVTDPSFAGFSVGDEVHIRDWIEDKDGYYVRILEDSDPDHPEGAPVWNTHWFTDDPAKVYKPTNPTNVQEDDMTENTTTPARPLIDFSGTSRATARSYAVDLQSRVNKPETNAALKAVEQGRKVDAYILAEALLDAMRHVSTRFGQSMARRRAGEKAAHLGYIVHGVLANHADDLPVYGDGERSRLLQDVRGALADAKQEVDTLVRERSDLTNAASAERRRLVEEIDGMKRQAVALVDQHDQYKAAADSEVTRLLALVEEQKQKLSVVEAERDAAAATIGYVVERLDGEDRAGILGYWEGVKDATLPSTEG